MKRKKNYRPLIALVWLSLVVVLASCVATKVGGAKPPANSQTTGPWKAGMPPMVLGNGPNEGGAYFFRRLKLGIFSSTYDTLPEIMPDFPYSLSIRTPGAGPTNVIVRSFYTRVASTGINPAYPSNLFISGTNYYDTNVPGQFSGSQSIALATNVGDWTDVHFQFKTNGFAAAGQGNGFITFVARGTNSGGQVFEGMYVYRFIGP